MFWAKLPEFFKGKEEAVVSIVAENEAIRLVSQFNEFQMFLLNSPEMTDEEYQFVQEKRRGFNQWK